MDALSIANTPPNYRYISDPASGLTTFFDASKFEIENIDIRQLGLSIPDTKNFKGMALHVKPKDGSPSFFEILMHNKSGTATSDQSARDQEAMLFQKIAIKLREIYPKTSLVRYQGDVNISSFVTKDNHNTSIEYLTNPENYEINTEGLNNLLTRLAPPGAVVTAFSATEVGIKERAENLLDCAQSLKLGYREGASKGACIQIEFLPFELTPEAVRAQQEAIISHIPLPSKSETIRRFGINAFDSDHRPTRPQVKNGHTFITAALINTFGPMGFQKEHDLILPYKNSPQDRAERQKLKKEWTDNVFSIIINEFHKKGLDISVFSDGSETLIDASKFILKYEWILINRVSLTSILDQIKSLDATKKLNTHCLENRKILDTSDKINDCLKRIFNKNYKITLLETEKTLTPPSKDELINIFRLDDKTISYQLRNHATDGQCGKVYAGSIEFELPIKGTLSEIQEESLRLKIIQDVNRQMPAQFGQKPTAIEGSQILNNLCDSIDWQLYAGFPFNERTPWNPQGDQNGALTRLVENGAHWIVTTELSSKKHLDAKKGAEKKEAQQRDNENYTASWYKNMDTLCERLNKAALKHRSTTQVNASITSSVTSESNRQSSNANPVRPCPSHYSYRPKT